MSSVLQFKATLDQILGSINELKRGSVSAQYGTVLGVSPLQVSLDDDPGTPLNGVPVSLVSGLVVGDRVWTVSFRSRTIVVGRVGEQFVADWYTDANSGTVAAGGDVSVAVLYVSLPRAARLQVTATQRMRASANSAGYIDLNVNGTITKSVRWHNNGQTQDQFPLLLTTFTLPAGNHTLNMRVRCASNSANAGIAQGWMEAHTI